VTNLIIKTYPEDAMCATLIGGMDRLKQDYIQTAKHLGFKLKVLTGKENNLAARLGNADLVIIFTNKINHAGREKAMAHAKANSIPVHRCHSCGVSSLSDCLRDA